MSKIVTIFHKIEKAEEKNLDKDLEKVVRSITRMAIRNAPYRTGALKASGKYEKVGQGAGNFSNYRISFTVGYAYFQEVGTVYHEGRWYLTNAVNYHRTALAEAMKDSFEKTWDFEVVKFNAGGVVFRL